MGHKWGTSRVQAGYRWVHISLSGGVQVGTCDAVNWGTGGAVSLRRRCLHLVTVGLLDDVTVGPIDWEGGSEGHGVW